MMAIPATAVARRISGPSDRAAITRQTSPMTTNPKAIVKRRRHPQCNASRLPTSGINEDRQRRGQQDRTGPLHADMDRRTQEKRKIDQHGPVAELEGGQQRGDPGHGRGREHARVEHWARTAPLLPDKQDCRCRTANDAGGSEDRGAVAPQQRIDRRSPAKSSASRCRRDPIVALPCRSSRRRVSGTARASARQKGMFAKKIQRQPSHEARKPPRVGPSAMATPEITPMTPNARAR